MSSKDSPATNPHEPRNTAGPLVTVCVPTVGRIKYLQQVLLALDGQTYRNLEILILDNASPAGAREMIDSYAATHARATVLRSENRLPMFANFNRGIEAAAGEYITFFHDDDVYMPSFIESHVAQLERSPGAGFAGGNFYILDRSGRQVRTRRLVRGSGRWSGRGFILDLVRRGRCALPTPGLVFRRSAIAATGFDESLPVNWGDFTVLMRIAETHDVAVLEEVTYGWRVHGENFSNLPFSSSIRMRTEVLLDYCREYELRHPGDARFTARLRRYVRRNHLRGLVWGWLDGSDDSDAAACLDQMRADRRGRVLATLLGAAGRAGLSLRVRRNALPFMRRLSEVTR